jgi:hypothetical protein
MRIQSGNLQYNEDVLGSPFQTQGILTCQELRMARRYPSIIVVSVVLLLLGIVVNMRENARDSPPFVSDQMEQITI